jgi:hypothetical protein
MSGWTRIWVVLSAVGCAVALYLSAQAYFDPAPARLVESAFADPDCAVKSAPSLKPACLWLARHLAAEPTVDTAARFRAYAADNRLTIAKDRILEYMGAWALLSAGLYLVGWATAWIRRGFRAKP